MTKWIVLRWFGGYFQKYRALTRPWERVQGTVNSEREDLGRSRASQCAPRIPCAHLCDATRLMWGRKNIERRHSLATIFYRLKWAQQRKLNSTCQPHMKNAMRLWRTVASTEMSRNIRRRAMALTTNVNPVRRHRQLWTGQIFPRTQ